MPRPLDLKNSVLAWHWLTLCPGFWHQKQLPLKEFSATTNFKSYDDLKAKFEKVVYGTGKTTTADEIDIPPVSAADVEVSEPKVSEPPQSETSPSDDEDDTMNYFSKLVND